MADLKISQLASLPGGSVDAADELPIVHLAETRKVTVKNLLEGGFDDIADASLSSAKVAFQANAISTVAINALAVTTDKIQNDAVTGAKLANDSAVVTGTSLPAAGDYTGQIFVNTTDNKSSYWNGSTWLDLKAKGSVNTVTGDTASLVNVTATANGDTIVLAASLDNTGAANQFLAGPTSAAGVAVYRTIDPSDLPVANTSLRGAVIVNGNGLTMDAGVIEIDNAVAAQNSPVFHKVAYNAQGLITSSSSVAGADLPIATSSSTGAVQPGTGLAVTGAGVLNHDNAIAAGTTSGISYDTEGHITNAVPLVEADIPNLPATKITTGSLDVARIASNTVTGAKLANYAITKIGDVQPAADQIGQFFFNPLTRDLYLWDGNVYQPIGISVGEIVFAGTFDASAGGGTGLVASVTDEGTAIGLTVGQALPAAATANNRYYLVVSEAGTITSGNAPQVALNPPDIVLSNGNEWTEVDVSQTITSVSANQVSFTPAGSIAASNVQAALEELDTEKLPKAGGTVTGELLIGNTGSLVFEGATDNAFETTVAVTDPTADRTITLPDVTGTVVTTGDTGSVTSTMIANGTIVDADVNASAAIAGSKIQAATTSNAGAVQLTDSTSSTSTTTAATPNAVKSAYDLANAALPKAGGTMTGTITFAAGQTISGYAALATAQTFTAAQRGTISALGAVSAGTTTLDFATANNFSLSLPAGGTVTLATPSNITAGQSGCIVITQNGTTAATVAYSTAWKWQGGAPSVSTTLSSVNVIAYFVESASRITAQLLTNTVN